MDWLLLLLVVYIGYFILSLLLAKGTIIAPSVIFSASFSVMLLMANLFRWLFQFRFKYRTFEVMAVAGLLYILVDNVYRAFYASVHSARRRGVAVHRPLESQHKVLTIQRGLLKLIMVLMSISLLLDIVAVYINTGGGSWMVRMRVYKDMLASRPDAVRLRFLVSQLLKINTALIHVCCYTLVYNTVACKVPVKKQLRIVALIPLYMFSSLMVAGGRQPSVELVVFMAIVAILLLVSEKRQVHFFRLFVIAAVLLVIFVLAFGLSANYIGRNISGNDLNPLLYVVRYLCGGLHYFNSIIDNPASTKYWGQNTFTGIYSKLVDFGLVPPDAHANFHTFGRFGNTTTLYGKWYEDFGAPGVYIMTCIFSLFFAWLFYKKTLGRPDRDIRAYDFAHIVYAKFAMALVWAGYDDRFSPLITFSNLVTMTVMALVYWFIIGKKIKFKIRPDSRHSALMRR